MLDLGTIITRRLVPLLAAAALFTSCSDDSPTAAVDRKAQPAASKPRVAQRTDAGRRATESRRVDPRKDGFEISLGEWAVTPEAPALRPGRVTFVITNRGTMPHGFEIELEGDSSGHGSGDLFEAEGPLLEPGETAKMTIVLSMTGLYKIECLVDGHDDMGMEGPLEVSRGARGVPARVPSDLGSVAIANFSFEPQILEIERGTEVTWRNDDPTDHTVTASEGAFSSETLGDGESFRHRFDEPGLFSYRCAIHPEMKGKVKVG